MLNSLADAINAKVCLPDGGVFESGLWWPWSDIFQLARANAACLRPLAGHALWMSSRSPVDALIALCTASILGCECWLQRPDVERPNHLDHIRIEHGLCEVLAVGSRSHESSAVTAGGIGVYTSGTTGRARPLMWTFLELASMARPVVGEGTWISAFPVATFAGLHTLVSAVLFSQKLYLLDSSSVLGSYWGENISLVCGTPTFWRRLLATSDIVGLTRSSPQVISLGGEIATQDLLDRLNYLFPQTRIVHVYATTELGTLFSISDGRAGFPATLLERPLHFGARLAVVDGQLLVRARTSPEFLPTGDAAHVVGERVLFDGRMDGVINVAGVKVHSHHVEETIRQLPFVSDVRVFPRSNYITGQVVAAEVSFYSETDSSALLGRVRQHCVQCLHRAARPRHLYSVPQVQTTPAGKVRREI